MAAMSKRRATATAVRRLVLEILGWTLVLAGIAALVLPGPGMLMLFAGLAVLSGRYQWARRLLRPVKIQALLGAAEGVETMPRIVLSTLLALGVGAGVAITVGAGTWLSSSGIMPVLIDASTTAWPALALVGTGLIGAAVALVPVLRVEPREALANA